jgi:hypothetical protein
MAGMAKLFVTVTIPFQRLCEHAENGPNLLSDTTTCVTPTTSQRIGAPHHVLVKESGTPHLTWYEDSPEDPYEEAQDKKSLDGVDSAGQGGGNGAEE